MHLLPDAPTVKDGATLHTYAAPLARGAPNAGTTTPQPDTTSIAHNARDTPAPATWYDAVIAAEDIERTAQNAPSSKNASIEAPYLN